MLTRKQHELLMFIHERIKESGVSPSFDEMKEALDLAYKSGIHRLITALEERGFLRRLPHRARALQVLQLPDAASVAGSRAAMSTLVSTVMMATLVVGPFYLSRALGLRTALVGIIMSAGPLVAAMTGVPGGRSVDRLGARRITIVGLAVMTAGCGALAIVPTTLGIAGYVVPIVLVTGGYALFQAANNTAAITDIRPDQRGVISGMLNLSRNLGLITGAAVMGAVFARAAATTDIAAARAADVATGMRTTFAAATILIIVALAIAAFPDLSFEHLVRNLTHRRRSSDSRGTTLTRNGKTKASGNK